MASSRRKLHFSPSEYHRYIMDNLEQEYAFKGGDLKKLQTKLRRKLKGLLGDWPKKKTPLNVRNEWIQEHKYGSIEKIIFTSEPFCDVPAYICLPKNAKAPHATMICLQGHSTGMHNSIGVNRENEMKKMKVEGDRDFAIGCMKNGIAALCIEQRSFGLRMEHVQKAVSSHMCHDAVVHALKLGKTLTLERVYDIERGLDYLATRKDIDMKRVGAMGNSGGGTVTTYAAALLPGISFAMPSCSFCTFRDSIMSIYHCGDNYVPGLLKYAEMADVMGLFAPKPVVVVAGKTDPIFPIKSVRKAFRDLKAIYKAAGAENNCKLVVGDGGHRFYADDAWPHMLKLIDKI